MSWLNLFQLIETALCSRWSSQ